MKLLLLLTTLYLVSINATEESKMMFKECKAFAYGGKSVCHGENCAPPGCYLYKGDIAQYKNRIFFNGSASTYQDNNDRKNVLNGSTMTEEACQAYAFSGLSVNPDQAPAGCYLYDPVTPSDYNDQSYYYNGKKENGSGYSGSDRTPVESNTSTVITNNLDYLSNGDQNVCRDSAYYGKTISGNESLAPFGCYLYTGDDDHPEYTSRRFFNYRTNGGDANSPSKVDPRLSVNTYESHTKCTEEDCAPSGCYQYFGDYPGNPEYYGQYFWNPVVGSNYPTDHDNVRKTAFNGAQETQCEGHSTCAPRGCYQYFGDNDGKNPEWYGQLFYNDEGADYVEDGSHKYYRKVVDADCLTKECCTPTEAACSLMTSNPAQCKAGSFSGATVCADDDCAPKGCYLYTGENSVAGPKITKSWYYNPNDWSDENDTERTTINSDSLEEKSSYLFSQMTQTDCEGESNYQGFSVCVDLQTCAPAGCYEYTCSGLSCEPAGTYFNPVANSGYNPDLQNGTEERIPKMLKVWKAGNEYAVFSGITTQTNNSSDNSSSDNSSSQSTSTSDSQDSHDDSHDTTYQSVCKTPSVSYVNLSLGIANLLCIFGVLMVSFKTSKSNTHRKNPLA